MAGQVTVTIADKEWLASLADTPWELVQGLGGIPEMAPGTGMLFDLGFEQAITVTTEPMLFPLDIAFLSESLVVTEIYRNVQPGYHVNSTLPARYFLEVNANELEGIDSGSQASVDSLPLQEVPVAPDWVSAMTSFMGFTLMGVFMVGLVQSLVEEKSADTPRTSARTRRQRRQSPSISKVPGFPRANVPSAAAPAASVKCVRGYRRGIITCLAGLAPRYPITASLLRLRQKSARLMMS